MAFTNTTYRVKECGVPQALRGPNTTQKKIVVFADSYWTQAVGNRIANGAAQQWMPLGGWGGWWHQGAQSSSSDMFWALNRGTDPAITTYSPAAAAGTGTPVNTIPVSFSQLVGTTPADTTLTGTTISTDGLNGDMVPVNPSLWRAGAPWQVGACDASLVTMQPGTEGGIGYKFRGAMSNVPSAFSAGSAGTYTAVDVPDTAAAGAAVWTKSDISFTSNTAGFDRPYLQVLNFGDPSSDNNAKRLNRVLFRIARPAGTTQPEIMFIGNAGWTVPDFGEVPASGGKITNGTFSRFSDFMDATHAIIALGYNRTTAENDEMELGTYAVFKADLETFIARVRAAYSDLEGILLISPCMAPLSGFTKAKAQLIADAMYEIASENTDIGVINGLTAVQNLHTQENDGTDHPNALGSNRFARAYWNAMFPSVTALDSFSLLR